MGKEIFVEFNEALKILGIDEKKLRAFITEGKISAYRDKGTLKFKKKDIEKLKQELQQEKKETSSIEEGDTALIDSTSLNIEDQPTTILSPQEKEEVNSNSEEDIKIELADEEIAVPEEKVEDKSQEIIVDEEDATDTVLQIVDEPEEGEIKLQLEEEPEDSTDTVIQLEEDKEKAQEVSLKEEAEEITHTIEIPQEAAAGEKDVGVITAKKISTTVPPSIIEEETSPSKLVAIFVVLTIIVLIYCGMIISAEILNFAPFSTSKFIPGYLQPIIEMIGK